MTTLRRKLTSNIGQAFTDAYGLKNLAFQLCELKNGRLESVAIVDIVEGDVVRFLAIPKIQQKQRAIERLAKIHAKTSAY